MRRAALAAGKNRLVFTALGSSDPGSACFFLRNLPSLLKSTFFRARFPRVSRTGTVALGREDRPARARQKGNWSLEHISCSASHSASSWKQEVSLRLAAHRAAEACPRRSRPPPLPVGLKPAAAARRPPPAWPRAMPMPPAYSQMQAVEAPYAARAVRSWRRLAPDQGVRGPRRLSCAPSEPATGASSSRRRTACGRTRIAGFDLEALILRGEPINSAHPPRRSRICADCARIEPNFSSQPAARGFCGLETSQRLFASAAC
jgi:hypothetical protein